MAGLALEIPERLADGSMVRSADLLHDGVFGDREQHAHALRSPKREIESGHGARRERLSERIARRRVLAAQQSQDFSSPTFAPRPSAAAAVPAYAPGVSPSPA